jgi:hypothetical protein
MLLNANLPYVTWSYATLLYLTYYSSALSLFLTCLHQSCVQQTPPTLYLERRMQCDALFAKVTKSTPYVTPDAIQFFLFHLEYLKVFWIRTPR